MTIRVRSAVAVAVVASLTFFVPRPVAAEPVTAPALSGAALTRFPGFAALPESLTLAAPVVLAGRLGDLAGAPAGGAQVLVGTWPSPATIGALPPGGQFDVVPLARTTAKRDGSYELRSLLTPALGALAGPDGLDIEINVFHAGRHFVYLSQLRPNLVEASWGGALVAGTVAPALSGRPGAPGVLDIALDPAQGEPLNAALPVSWPPPTSPGEPPFAKRERPFGVTCVTYKKIGDPKPAMTTVATAVARNGAGMHALYEAGASTASSTGFSFDGGVSFSVNGSRERTMTTGAEFYGEKSKPGKAVARAYGARVEHQTLRRVCKGDKFDEYRVHYVTTPIGLTGGTGTAKIHKPWTCDPAHTEPAEGAKEMYTQNHRAATYGSAFSFKPLGGVSFAGNAQSGYSETVKITYHFDRGVEGFWCGDKGYPASNGQRVQAFVR